MYFSRALRRQYLRFTPWDDERERPHALKDLEATLAYYQAFTAFDQILWAAIRWQDRPVTLGRLQTIAPGLPNPAREQLERSWAIRSGVLHAEKSPT